MVGKFGMRAGQMAQPRVPVRQTGAPPRAE